MNDLGVAQGAVPDRREFGAAMVPNTPTHRSIAQLHGHLVTLDPSAPLPVQIEMFERLGRWVTAGLPPPSSLWVPPEPPAVARLRIAVTALERFPELKSRWVSALGDVLSASIGVKLFAETGMPNDRGLVQETSDRLARRFLPRPPEHGQLAELFARIFRHPRDATWIPAIPDDLFARLMTLFGDVWQPAREWITDAIALICTRISALGLSEDMREDDPSTKLRNSPFFRLPRASLDELPGLLV
ncbi:MAG TPA: hypothetical protein VIG06_17165, partial [Kofleriaceae bacterium]